MTIYSEMESAVQCYARSFPTEFNRAQGVFLFDSNNRQYLDFLAGAGALNYGHNHPVLKQALLNYIAADGVTHSLDLHTVAKSRFLEAFRNHILRPRQLDYRLQFTGPTGTNAIEAALKLARKIKGRRNILSFTNGFHGVTLGSVAATGNSHHRSGAQVSLNDVVRMPYCGYFGDQSDSLAMIEQLLSDPSSGIDLPAAVLVETVQGEGGLNVASDIWLQGLARLCKRHDMLLIIDDIQAGCGRTGTFFSFEPSGIKPDMVTLSKSLSACGLPMAVLCLRPELDQWQPGEHNGTFRGNNYAFVTATAAIQHFWLDDNFSRAVAQRAAQVTQCFQQLVSHFGNEHLRRKGRGLMQGLECRDGELAGRISQQAFDKGLIIETAGNRRQVVKCFCPLTISESELGAGLERLSESFHSVLGKQLRRV
ncbi:diaminobutyrate--2-oxoglutarate transaminase [Zobellella sp. DQSA1]|uniref:diaminobutyrate--2-oxoglutarate transaminase n=1 Tax=Zobellella sp. DQSA1 TaxID=3342386 RepID=UPI0035C188A9